MKLAICFYGYPSSSRSSFNQTASWVACDKAIYSASVEEIATVDCFVLFQLIVDPLRIKIKPDVDFRSPRSPAWSESE